MQAGARLTPPSANDVKAAMAQFPAQTQRDLAAFQDESPGRMRQFAAQHVASPSLSAGQRDALLTLGSAPKDALKTGTGQAINALDASAEAERQERVDRRRRQPTRAPPRVQRRRARAPPSSPAAAGRRAARRRRHRVPRATRRRLGVSQTSEPICRKSRPPAAAARSPSRTAGSWTRSHSSSEETAP